LFGKKRIAKQNTRYVSGLDLLLKSVSEFFIAWVDL